MDVESYHLRELAVALDPANPRRLNPPIRRGEKVLDIGCGAGQTLIAACPDRRGIEGAPADSADVRAGLRAGCAVCAVDPCPKEGWAVGIDFNFESVSLGRSLSNRILFACADGTALPFAPCIFDLVICRVSLQEMNTAAALPEIARVLRPGGRVWMTLHPFGMCWKRARRGDWKSWIRFVYVVANSLTFCIFGRQFRCPFIIGHYDSFQTEGGMRRALRRAGFGEINCERGRFFLMTAVKTPGVTGTAAAVDGAMHVSGLQ